MACPEASAETAWQLAVDQMLRRDTPRPFVRYPEHVYAYLQDTNGLYLQLTSTMVFQAADASRTDRDELFNANLNFVGGLLLGKESGISWWVRGGRALGDERNADLSVDIGSILDVNASLESNTPYVRDLYWAGQVSESLRLAAGIVDSSYRYDFNEAANDEGCCFLSTALVNSPAIPFPEPGLSVEALWRVAAATELHAGYYQASCTNEDFVCVRDLDFSEVFLPVEIIQTVDLDGLGTGRYRLLGFYSDTKNGQGGGVSLSVVQEMGRFQPFLRLSLSEQNAAEIDRFVSFGTAFNAPFGREWDAIGVGFARGRPANRELRTETLVEAYWRVQLMPFIALSPNVQVIIDPANNPAEDRITVVGVRFQLEL